MANGAQWGDSGGSGNPWLDMIVSMFGQQLMPEGMTLGQFRPTQNLMDTLSSREFGRGSMGAAMDLGSARGAQTIQELLTGVDGEGGLASMLGIDPGAVGQIQSADVGRAAGQVLPWASMAAPGMLDALGMGEMTAAYSHAQLFRPHMRTPPLPGQAAGPGLDAEGLRTLTKQVTGGVSQQLYGPAGTDLRQTHGIRKGFGAGLMRQAQQMGIGVNIGAQMDDPRGLSTTIANRQRSLSRGAAAVRDLGGQFAGMNPEQMLSTLDQLSMGRLSRGEDAEELGEQVRMFKQLSRQADVTYGEGAMLQQIAGARSAQLGGSETFGTVGGQHALGFAAYAKQRGDLAASAGVSVSEMAQQDAYLTAQAAQSEMGNEAAALMRMGESGMLKEGTAAHNAFTKLKNEGKLDPMDRGQFRQMLKQSGVNMSVASTILNQRDENRQAFGDEVAGAVRANQWEADIAPFMQRMVANQLGTAAGGRMNAKQAMAVGGMVTQTLQGMAGKSRSEMHDALVEKFEGMGLKGDAAIAAAEVALGAAGQAARHKGYTGDEQGHAVGHAVAMHSEEAMTGISEEEKRAEREAEAEKAVAHEQKDVAERTVEAIKRGDPNLGKLVAKVAGAIGIDLGGDEEEDPAAARRKGYKSVGHAAALHSEEAMTGISEKEKRAERADDPAEADDVDAADAADMKTRKEGEDADVDSGKDTQQDAGQGGIQQVEVVNTPTIKVAGEGDVPAGDKMGANTQPLDAGGPGS